MLLYKSIYKMNIPTPDTYPHTIPFLSACRGCVSVVCSSSLFCLLVPLPLLRVGVSSGTDGLTFDSRILWCRGDRIVPKHHLFTIMLTFGFLQTWSSSLRTNMSTLFSSIQSMFIPKSSGCGSYPAI